VGLVALVSLRRLEPCVRLSLTRLTDILHLTAFAAPRALWGGGILLQALVVLTVVFMSIRLGR
jgi:hypothetical protein